MRALVSAVPGYGHLQPLLPLASALRAAGHDVAIATGSEMCARAESAGFEAFATGCSIAAAFERLAERFPGGEYTRLPPAGILDWYLPHLFGEILAPATLEDLEPLVESWHPDVVIHDTWELAAPVAAARAGVPSISQTLGLRFEDALLNAIAAAVAPLWVQRGLEPDATAGLYRHMCFDITPPSLQPCTPPVGEWFRALRPIAQPPLTGERAPDWLAARLRKRVKSQQARPLVYMTLGTNTNTNVSVFRAVIEGLTDLEVDVLMTVGPDKASASVGSLPANMHAESYVPQSLVLPRCSVVICHGGAGTTLAALATGLPLLILPQGADQYVIGEMIVGAHPGVRLVPSEVNSAAIRSSVVALLNEHAYRSNAYRLQCEIGSMPAPDTAVELIEDVVRTQQRI